MNEEKLNKILDEKLANSAEGMNALEKVLKALSEENATTSNMEDTFVKIRKVNEDRKISK